MHHLKYLYRIVSIGFFNLSIYRLPPYQRYTFIVRYQSSVIADTVTVIDLFVTVHGGNFRYRAHIQAHKMAVGARACVIHTIWGLRCESNHTPRVLQHVSNTIVHDGNTYLTCHLQAET